LAKYIYLLVSIENRKKTTYPIFVGYRVEMVHWSIVLDIQYK